MKRWVLKFQKDHIRHISLIMTASVFNFLLYNIFIHMNFRVEIICIRTTLPTEYAHVRVVYACTFISLIENYSVTLNIRSQCVLPDLIKLIDSFAFLLAMVIRISRLSGGKMDRNFKELFLKYINLSDTLLLSILESLSKFMSETGAGCLVRMIHNAIHIASRWLS